MTIAELLQLDVADDIRVLCNGVRLCYRESHTTLW